MGFDYYLVNTNYKVVETVMILESKVSVWEIRFHQKLFRGDLSVPMSGDGEDIACIGLEAPITLA